MVATYSIYRFGETPLCPLSHIHLLSVLSSPNLVGMCDEAEHPPACVPTRGRGRGFGPLLSAYSRVAGCLVARVMPMAFTCWRTLTCFCVFCSGFVLLL